jgi:hypothetical protein
MGGKIICLLLISGQTAAPNTGSAPVALFHPICSFISVFSYIDSKIYFCNFLGWIK